MYSTLSPGSPFFLQSSAVSCKRSPFLPVNANLAPQRESSTAHAHPMPLLAPENTIHIWSTSQGLCVRFLFCFIRVCYRSVMPIFFTPIRYPWNGKVARMTAPLVTGDVEGKLQRPQWRPEQSSWRPFRFCDWHRDNHAMTPVSMTKP